LLEKWRGKQEGIDSEIKTIKEATVKIFYTEIEDGQI
jgi:hypothetical protein